ncbi:MAG: BrnT family toxin [Halioglobus sp.]|nr:BrnT family toxin [Halioglobus sp.]
MKFEWDEVKATANFAKHGVRFEDASEFEWEVSVDKFDLRKDYGETRVMAMSTIRGRLHVLVYAIRADGHRLISLRKANDREFSSYEKTKKLKTDN